MLVCRLSALFAWVWFGQVFFVLKMLGWLGLLRRRIWADWVQKTGPMSISAWTVSLPTFVLTAQAVLHFRARTNRHRQSETKTMPTPRPPPMVAADVESLKSAVAVTVQLCYVM